MWNFFFFFVLFGICTVSCRGQTHAASDTQYASIIMSLKRNTFLVFSFLCKLLPTLLKHYSILNVSSKYFTVPASSARVPIRVVQAPPPMKPRHGQITTMAELHCGICEVVGSSPQNILDHVNGNTYIVQSCIDSFTVYSM